MSSMRLKSSIATVSLLIGLGLSASAAMACDHGCAPPAPPSPPSRPSTSHSHSTSTATATATATASASARAGSSSTVVYGGGYSNWSQTPGTPQTMPLNVVVAEPAPTLVPAQVRIVETQRTEKVVQKKVVKKAVKKKVIKASCVTVAKVVKKPVPKPVKRVVVKKAAAAQVAQQSSKTIIERTVVYESLGGQVINSGYSTQSNYASSSYASQSYQSASNLVFRATALQASCMDDQSNPRAAAMTRPERELDAGYIGEIYRCAPSERLVVTTAAFDGNQATFNGGRNLSCAKGNALWYERGGLFCRPAIAAKSGYETDLIQRYGTGIKVVNMAYVQSAVREATPGCNCLNGGAALTTMVFDGGVGGFVQ